MPDQVFGVKERISGKVFLGFALTSKINRFKIYTKQVAEFNPGQEVGKDVWALAYHSMFREGSDYDWRRCLLSARCRATEASTISF